MIIECTNCKTKYKVEDNKISSKRTTFRCTRCSEMFVVDKGKVESKSEEVPASGENLFLEFTPLKKDDINSDDAKADRSQSGSVIDLDEGVNTKKSNGDLGNESFDDFSVVKELNYEKKGENTTIFSEITYNFLSIVLIIFMVVTAFFVLGSLGVIPKNIYDKPLAYITNYINLGDEDKFSEYATVKDVNSEWVKTKNGYLFLVTGNVVNKHSQPLSYIKLKAKYSSADEDLYIQEFYSGNTLTVQEIKNSSKTDLLKKLSRKDGDIDRKGVKSGGKNFNIKPEESVFFYTFYLSRIKILGLKADIDIVDLDIFGNK